MAVFLTAMDDNASFAYLSGSKMDNLPSDNMPQNQPVNSNPNPGSIKARKRTTRWGRRILVVCFMLALISCARPAWHLLRTSSKDTDTREATPPGFVDDASRLNVTKVNEVWPVPTTDPEAAEQQLAELLDRAQRENLQVSIAGSRHTMGGHTIYPGGIAINMLPFNQMHYDAERELLHVQAGARWSEIISYLDPLGLSVAIMQSNNSFSVGGSLSVNCHGWTYGKPPIASSVESFRLMKADGEIVRCSRTENTELFSAVLGGYGLFGIILDAELRVVPNQRYRLKQYIVPMKESLVTFDQALQNHPNMEMAYARMNIMPERFLQDVILNILVAEPAADGQLPPLSEPGMVELRRSLFRGSEVSDYGKKLRWSAETKLQPHLSKTYFSRNQLLNESVEVFENRSAGTTDILHEYFVPRSGLPLMVQQMQKIIPRHDGNLLNVTIREIETDKDTLLRYADQPMFSFVMLFSQKRTPNAEVQMEAMTQELIDAALRVGGRYYLPYRLHATEDQFMRCYPMAQQFFELKRKYDPQELFQNQFYLKYGKLERAAQAN